MLDSPASLRDKIDRFLHGFKDLSAREITEAMIGWQDELIQLTREAYAACKELNATRARLHATLSESERYEAQVELVQATSTAEEIMQKLEEAIFTVNTPDTFIHHFLKIINHRISFADRSASLSWIRKYFAEENKGQLPKVPAARQAILQRRKEDEGLEISLFKASLMAAGRSEEIQTVRTGTRWLKDKKEVRASVVPSRYFGPATAEFQSWFRKETINFLEADLLHREHPLAIKDALNEPREPAAHVDGIEHNKAEQEDKLTDYDVGSVRSDLAERYGPEGHAIAKDLLEVLKRLSPDDRDFLTHSDGARGASGADRTRLSRLRKKIKDSL